MTNKNVSIVNENVSINIGGKDYELILNTRAMKEIGKRYGGIDKFGEALLSSNDAAFQFDEMVGIITLLANQSILIHNVKNPDDIKEPLTEEIVELLTTPSDFEKYGNAMMAAINIGIKQEVKSEVKDERKNQTAVG